MTQSEILLYVQYASREELVALSAAIKAANKKFPKQPALPKQPRPKTAEQIVKTDGFNLFREWFLQQPTFEDFYIDGAQAAGISKILGFLVYRYKRKNKDELPTGRQLFQNMQFWFTNLPVYWNDKINFNTLAAHFDSIVLQIGKNLQNEQQSDPIQAARKLNALRHSQRPGPN